MPPNMFSIYQKMQIFALVTIFPMKLREIVKENPSLAITGKARLLELARNKLDKEGYNYKKGRSRTLGTGGATPKKRVFLSAQLKREKINHLKEDMAELELQMKLTETQRDKFTTAKKLRP